MTEARRRGAIDRDRMVADLGRSIRIPSITGSEEAVAAWAADALRELGLRGRGRRSPIPAAIRADPDWPGEEMPRTSLPVVIGRAGRAGGRRGSSCPAMSTSSRPAIPRPGRPIRGAARSATARLYGRGACDMKGGVASILAAVRALVAAGALDRLDGEVLVVLVPSEEDGGQGTLAAIRAGATGDLAVITEPTGLDVVIAHAGAITFRLTVPGRAAHASQRREGVSALDNLYTLIRALEADEAARNAAETDPLMTALGPAVPDDHRQGVGRGVGLDRARPGRRRGPLRRAARPDRRRTRRRTCGRASPRPAPRIRSCASTRRRSRSPAASSARRACRPTIRCRSGSRTPWRRVTGRRPALLGEPYGADMRLFVNEGATPCVIFGPGDVRVAHSADEHVPLDEVETAPGSSPPGSAGSSGRALTALRPAAAAQRATASRGR